MIFINQSVDWQINRRPDYFLSLENHDESMFLALRDIAYARGRFALMTAVVGLITLLLVMLSGLTGGLSKQNTSALEALDPAGVVFSSDEPSFSDSQIDRDFAADYPGATALGVSQTRIASGDEAGTVAVMGLPEGSLVPGTETPVKSGQLQLSETAAEDVAASAGELIQVGGEDARVAGTVPDEFYSHSPVAWTTTETWREVAHAPQDVVGTVLLTEDADAPGAVSLKDALGGLASYQSERGSLLTMQGFLYAISALVTVAFLTVWTIQRTRDLSILRALGADGSYLRRDALGQAAVVLGLGTVLGAVVGWGLGEAAAQALPFELSINTVLVPAVGIWLLGLVGAALATRKVSRTDPMLALGGAA